jgi:hypothetical protein
MSTATDNKLGSKGNIFDEDITTAYSLDLPAPRTDAYAIHVYKTVSPDEQHMLTAFHKQYVAVEGRSAVGQLVDTRIGDLTIHTAQVMGVSMESVERIEIAAHLGRLSRRLQGFDDSLLEQTGRLLLETNAIAIRTMHEDMRQDAYPPPPAPAPKKKKGLIPGTFTFLFGER